MSKKKMQVWQAWKSNESIDEFLAVANRKASTFIFCQEEWEINYKFRYSKFKKLKSCDLVFGTYDKEFHHRTTTVSKYPNVRLHVWHNHWLFFSFGHSEKSSYKESKVPDALFTCMNHAPHFHRIMMVDMLEKHGLLDSNYYSWHSTDFESPYNPKYWTPSVKKLDGDYKLFEFPEEMFRSVIDLVTESQDQVPFITEKTYNAILRKKPFVVLGCPGMHAELERQGFKLPHDVIDYSFDKETDTLKRAEMVALELKRLSKFDLGELQESLRETVEFNRKHALEVLRRQEGIPDVMKYDNYVKQLLEDIKCKLDSLESES